MTGERNALGRFETSSSQPLTPLGIPRLLTSEEASAVLCICTKTLLTLARAGELPGVRVGTQWRFDLADLQAWIRDRKAASAASRGA